MRAAREQHQILTVGGPVVAHLSPSPVRIGWAPNWLPVDDAPLYGSPLNNRLRKAVALPPRRHGVCAGAVPSSPADDKRRSSPSLRSASSPADDKRRSSPS